MVAVYEMGEGIWHTKECKMFIMIKWILKGQCVIIHFQ